jgi:hypothetical protein
MRNPGRESRVGQQVGWADEGSPTRVGARLRIFFELPLSAHLYLLASLAATHCAHNCRNADGIYALSFSPFRTVQVVRKLEGQPFCFKLAALWGIV